MTKGEPSTLTINLTTQRSDGDACIRLMIPLPCPASTIYGSEAQSVEGNEME